MLICLKINMQAEKYGYEVLEEKMIIQNKN